MLFPPFPLLNTARKHTPILLVSLGKYLPIRAPEQATYIFSASKRLPTSSSLRRHSPLPRRARRTMKKNACKAALFTNLLSWTSPLLPMPTWKIARKKRQSKKRQMSSTPFCSLPCSPLLSLLLGPQFCLPNRGTGCTRCLAFLTNSSLVVLLASPWCSIWMRLLYIAAQLPSPRRSSLFRFFTTRRPTRCAGPPSRFRSLFAHTR